LGGTHGMTETADHSTCRVHNVTADASGVTVSTTRDTIYAARVVVALPPRLAAGLGVDVPDVPTWMPA